MNYSGERTVYHEWEMLGDEEQGQQKKLVTNYLKWVEKQELPFLLVTGLRQDLPYK
jgi:hypothetical protein